MTMTSDPTKEVFALPMEPRWADLNYPGLSSNYTISTLGEVKSPAGKLLTPSKSGKYDVVSIRNLKGIPSSPRVDRLVLSTFVSYQPLETPVHLDGINSNNRLDNLAWGDPTPKELGALRIALKHRQEGRPARKSKKTPRASKVEAKASVRDEVVSTRTYEFRGVRVEVGDSGDIRSMTPDPAKGLSIGQTLALVKIMEHVGELHALLGTKRYL